MNARGLAWILLVWSTSACRDRSAPTPGPPAAGSSATAAAAAADAAIADAAAADAAVAAAAAADAAAADAAARTIAIGRVVPDLGCLGGSPRRELAACIAGVRGSNLGDGTKVELAYFAVSEGAEVPPRIPILVVGEGQGRGLDDLPPALAAQLTSELEGFAPWSRDGALITTRSADDKLVVGPPISVGGMTIAVRLDPAPPQGYAPAYSALLTVRVPGGARHVVAETTGSVSGLEVRAFAIRDRSGRGAVLVEQVHHIADEGMYGRAASFWMCTASGCEAR